jgi:hypothetical protein
MKKDKKDSALDKYLIFSLSFIVIYTIVHTIIFAISGVEATTLDILVYGFFGTELCYCFLIKRFKLHDEAKIVLSKKKKEDDFDVSLPFTDEERGEFE